MPGKVRHSHASVTALAAMLLAAPAWADEATTAATPPASGQTIRPLCHGSACSLALTPPQLLALAERLVQEGKFDDARPLVAALGAAPGMEVPHDFLGGLLAMEDGDPKTAASHFRAILENHPGQTRVRLELARALMMQGKFRGADYHLRLAEGDEQLPEEIARQVSNARSIIRSNRRFRFGFDFGFAPDSNINSATAAETVNVNFGPMRVPVELDDAAREQSGLGLTGSFYAGVRMPMAENVALVADLDTDAVKYEDSDFDDYSVQLAAGPEFRLTRGTDLRIQAVGLQRWYGGRDATRQYGAKATVQHDLSRSQRIAFQIDGRRTESGINPGYDGWQLGANATYEHVVGKSALASLSAIARRDFLNAEFYSSQTAGLSGGIAAELPMGINAGVSGGALYSVYDAPQTFFSTEKREDWRFQSRAHAGLRSFRVAGFSPSVEYQFVKVNSNYDLYATERHRFHFKLARYF